jgi:DmsE family decaheme c-type cytochrome
MAKKYIPLITMGVGITFLVLFNIMAGAVWSSEDEYMDSYIGADADKVGSETCLMCHSNQNPGNLFTHVALLDNDPGNENYGFSCEGCHGPGGKHMGVPQGIINPAKLSVDGITDLCTKCHTTLMSYDKEKWFLSEHYNSDLGCLECHGGHSENDAFLQYDDVQEQCYSCHAEKRAQFSMRSRHPVSEQQMGCVNCHNPHSGEFDNQLVMEQNDLCYSCHTDKQGPFIFDHNLSMSAGGDGCLTCHEVHGSNNDNLLRLPGRRLCLQCHTDRTPDVHFNATCWTAGCHTNIHGSNAHALFLQ